jgi:hypothetical protein
MKRILVAVPADTVPDDMLRDCQQIVVGEKWLQPNYPLSAFAS